MRMAGEVPAGLDWYDRNAEIPGNYFVMPNQAAEHTSPSGSADLQYPMFRLDLVNMGLLPAELPDGARGGSIKIPAGMTIREAIARGLLK